MSMMKILLAFREHFPQFPHTASVLLATCIKQQNKVKRGRYINMKHKQCPPLPQNDQKRDSSTEPQKTTAFQQVIHKLYSTGFLI